MKEKTHGINDFLFSILQKIFSKNNILSHFFLFNDIFSNKQETTLIFFKSLELFTYEKVFKIWYFHILNIADFD
jgi:hypothetical protein